MSQSQQEVKHNLFMSGDGSNTKILVTQLKGEKDENLVFELHENGETYQVMPPNSKGTFEKILLVEPSERIVEPVVRLTPPSSPLPESEVDFSDCGQNHETESTQALIVDEDEGYQTGNEESKMEMEETGNNDVKIDEDAKKEKENAKIRYDEFHKYLNNVFSEYLKSKIV